MASKFFVSFQEHLRWIRVFPRLKRLTWKAGSQGVPLEAFTRLLAANTCPDLKEFSLSFGSLEVDRMRNTLRDFKRLTSLTLERHLFGPLSLTAFESTLGTS